MRPLKVKLSIVLDEEVRAGIQVLAGAESRSFSGQVNYILKQFLVEKSSKPTKPEETPPAL